MVITTKEPGVITVSTYVERVEPSRKEDVRTRVIMTRVDVITPVTGAKEDGNSARIVKLPAD
jgi:hypothetical protein